VVPLFHIPVWKGTSQEAHPVFAGDLLRVKRLGYGWSLEGRPFLVLDIPDEDRRCKRLGLAPETAIGLLEGAQCMVRIEDLDLYDHPEDIPLETK